MTSCTCLEWKDLEFTKGKKKILKRIGGRAESKELLAIMGPSGAGKSTLLNALAKRISFQGTMEYHNICSKVAYVPQKHLLHYASSVYDILRYSFVLRTGITDEVVVDKHVSDVLNLCQISGIRDRLIGTESKGGLSGGEIKRVSIAYEIAGISDFGTLLVDEPTSGLDSSLSYGIMKYLAEFARKKDIVVICTIHQPSSLITELFSKLYLVRSGSCVFFGDLKQLRSSLTIHNDVIHQNWSLAETCIDVIDKLEIVVYTPLPGPAIAKQASSNSSSVSLFLQTKELVIRSLKQWAKDENMFFSELAQYIIFGLLIGGMYYNVSNTVDEGSYNRVSSLFFILSVLVFTPSFTAAVIFFEEKRLICKEMADKIYHPLALLISRTLVSLLMEGFLCLLFSIVVYFLVGYQSKADKFFIFFAIVFLFQMISESLGLMIGIFSTDAMFSVILLSLLFVIVLSLAGFLTYSMPVYFRWFMDMNFLRFAWSALITNEFDGLSWDPPASSPSASLSPWDYLTPLMRAEGSIVSNVGWLLLLFGGVRLVIMFLLFQLAAKKHDVNDGSPSNESDDDLNDENNKINDSDVGNDVDEQGFSQIQMKRMQVSTEEEMDSFSLKSEV